MRLSTNSCGRTTTRQTSANFTGYPEGDNTMGNAHKHGTNKQLNDIAKQLAHWSKKAKQDYPQHLEDALRHAVDKLDPQALSEASANIVAMVTGNRKAAKHVRKSVAGTVAKVQRSYGTKPAKGHGVLYGLGAAALVLAACLAAMWRATRSIERSPQPAQRIPSDGSADGSTGASAHATAGTLGIDPDLGAGLGSGSAR